MMKLDLNTCRKGDILTLRNGKFYTGTVEFVIAEADPEYVKEVLDEDD